MKKGDIVLVPFPFVESELSKIRPALILSKPISNNIILAFITTNLSGINLEYKLRLEPSETNRLKEISVVRLDKLATIGTSLIRARLGKIEGDSLIDLNSKLMFLFDLGVYRETKNNY